MVEARSHHDKICHDIVLPDGVPESLHEFIDLWNGTNGRKIVPCGSRTCPIPRIAERFDLCGAFTAALFFEQDVIIAVRVKRRIEIDQIDAVIGNMIFEQFKVITKIESVHDRHLG